MNKYKAGGGLPNLERLVIKYFLVPIVRFIIMTNHSYNHAYFTYRAFIPLIITLLIIIIKGLPIFKNKKIIDNKL